MEGLAVRPPDPEFWRGRRVLVTGHTGFKGAWLSLMLSMLGARVIGLALDPPPGPALFPLLAPRLRLEHHIIDLRDRAAVAGLVAATDASIVLHLAAQALVPLGQSDPLATFAVNLGGTLNLLEALRARSELDAVVLVTTDKVYRNRNEGRRFRESDPLGGNDPYSASKAAAELAIACWRESFAGQLPPMATARAGNVIGGGDFAPTRLIPDIVRAVAGAAPLVVRYPQATRPWQYVLDVLSGYLLLAQHLAEPGQEHVVAMNFAPLADSVQDVAGIIAAFAAACDVAVPWRSVVDPGPEALSLDLDASLASATLGWRPRLDHAGMLSATAHWYRNWLSGEDMAAYCADAVSLALS